MAIIKLHTCNPVAVVQHIWHTTQGVVYHQWCIQCGASRSKLYREGRPHHHNILSEENLEWHFPNQGHFGSIPLLLTCPTCNRRHIDEGEWATRPHHTHSCQHCGHTWRPAIENTVGVKFLPGFKNTKW